MTVQSSRATLLAAAPTRKRATSSIGFWVADKPTRNKRPPQSAARRSSDRARWVPRLFAASAWISSTITARGGREHRASGLADRAGCRAIPGVVTTMCGGRRRMRSRSPGGVSPVRTQVRISTSGKPRALRLSRMPASGASRLRLDVVRQRLERRHIDDLGFVFEAAVEPLPHPGRRWRRERLRASCPIRSAPRSAHAGRPGTRAKLAPARPWAQQSCGQTKPQRQDETNHLASWNRNIGRQRDGTRGDAVHDIWVSRRPNQSTGTARPLQHPLGTSGTNYLATSVVIRLGTSPTGMTALTVMPSVSMAGDGLMAALEM